MPRLVLHLMISALTALASEMAYSQEPSSGPFSAFVTQIAPDLAVVTELSVVEPFVGQQFSVVYRLRALHPPAAVDIDPQQYPGFWTEVVPIAPDSGSTARPAKGQPGVDYLLRQIVAYPLLHGSLRLPPLSVKVKRAGSIPAQRDDWDVLGTSDPVDVRAMELPPWPRGAGAMPLTGKIAGKLAQAGDGQSGLLLEMEGTANLALFQPLDWLTGPAGIRLQARLAASDNVAQTIEREGRRQLTLIQRQRWLISLSGGSAGQRVGDLLVPLFDPQEKAWKELRVEGILLPQAPAAAPVREGEALPAAPSKSGSGSGDWRIFAAAGLAVALAGWFVVRRLRKTGGRRVPEGFEALEKLVRTSPRGFLDSAHRVLEQRAMEVGRSRELGVGDGPMDRCWITVQRYRFNREPLPPAARNEILKAIREILRSPQAATGPATSASAPNKPLDTL